MSKTDPNLRAKLQRAPTYQKALRGQWTAPGMPNTPGFRAEHLRAAARADGIEIPSGYAFDKGTGSFTDANADHWYSDPRVLGPAAVGAAGGVGALAGAPAGIVGGGIVPVGASVPATANAVAPLVAAGGGGVAKAFGGSWLAPLLNYGVPAVTGLVGQKMANSADAEAARIQTAYLDRALEVAKEQDQYGRGQRADYLGRLKPYGDVGTAAVGRANNLITGSRYRPDVMAASAGTVALRDSAGVVRHVPAAEADQWIARGAERA